MEAHLPVLSLVIPNVGRYIGGEEISEYFGPGVFLGYYREPPAAHSRRRLEIVTECITSMIGSGSSPDVLEPATSAVGRGGGARGIFNHHQKRARKLPFGSGSASESLRRS